MKATTSVASHQHFISLGNSSSRAHWNSIAYDSGWIEDKVAYNTRAPGHHCSQGSKQPVVFVSPARCGKVPFLTAYQRPPVDQCFCVSLVCWEKQSALFVFFDTIGYFARPIVYRWWLWLAGAEVICVSLYVIGPRSGNWHHPVATRSAKHWTSHIPDVYCFFVSTPCYSFEHTLSFLTPKMNIGARFHGCLPKPRLISAFVVQTTLTSYLQWIWMQ